MPDKLSLAIIVITTDILGKKKRKERNYGTRILLTLCKRKLVRVTLDETK